MTTITKKIEFVTRNRRKCLTAPAEPKKAAPQARVPRISKLMALAIRLDMLLRNGTVRDMSELARLARVTQPRMTQILNLNHLSPDIQEELLFLTPVTNGRDQIHERTLRAICSVQQWSSQRSRWRSLRGSAATG